MAGSNRKDWEDLNVTKEEVENIKEALKKEEFRKLLVEYAEEITDPKNRKQYQDDIVQLEAERGVDCTFVNPEPGFVIKTSIDGKKKAFINVCKNNLIGKPSSKPVVKDNNRGLSWSIPYSQAPGREDHDKKHNKCIVYDVIFHPDTLHLAEKNSQFKKLVMDTALNAVEDSYDVKLDKKNIKLPKLKFKGLPFATVIRKKSEKQPILSEEDIEFHKQLNYPFKSPSEEEPKVKNFDNKNENKEKYTVPKYVIKHRSGIELEEYTYDKNAKMDTAIPKELIIEVNLPLLNSTKQVMLDVMEKSVHLKCEKPSKYKLDIQLPYIVCEEAGNAKFDKEKRLLIITLPVVKPKINAIDLMREDSGVESDFGDRNHSDDSSPVGSVGGNKSESDDDLRDQDLLIEEIKVDGEEIIPDNAYRTKAQVEKFLDADQHYVFPSFRCNMEDNRVCFLLLVKNVDESSVVKKMMNSTSFHIKFTSIGSGFFPIHHAFFAKFEEGCDLKDGPKIDVWDNNVTVLMEFQTDSFLTSKYYVGVDEDSLSEKYFDEMIKLEQIMEEIKLEHEKAKNENDAIVTVVSAHCDEVVVQITPKTLLRENHKPESFEDDEESAPSKDSEESGPSKDSEESEDSEKSNLPQDNKIRTLSESSGDELVTASPVTRKSILKNRICRSLSESNADDYVLSSSLERNFSTGSDTFIIEEENKDSKKTVRFNENIRKQTFRANSSILGQRKKNQKRTRNKRRALERRASESENSEGEDRERDKRTQENSRKGPLAEVLSNDNCDVSEAVIMEENENVSDDTKQKGKAFTSEARNYDFKSDLIFDLDM